MRKLRLERCKSKFIKLVSGQYEVYGFAAQYTVSIVKNDMVLIVLCRRVTPHHAVSQIIYGGQ